MLPETTEMIFVVVGIGDFLVGAGADIWILSLEVA